MEQSFKSGMEKQSDTHQQQLTSLKVAAHWQWMATVPMLRTVTAVPEASLWNFITIAVNIVVDCLFGYSDLIEG